MTYDLIKDYLSAFIGCIFILLSLILIPEIKKSKKNILFIFLSVLLTFILGIEKINRDSNEREQTSNKSTKDDRIINTLGKNIATLIKFRQIDSSNFSQFKSTLKTKYNIIDSANTPVIYNTYIHEAKNVTIGGK